MAAANTDKFKKLTNNFSTTLSSAIVGASDTSMSLSSTTNLPTDTGAVFVIDRVNSSGTATPTLREYVVGTVSGSNVTNLVRGVGNSTAQAHSTGAVVEQVVDQRTINDLMDGILVQHNQDGTHGAVTATSVTATGTVQGATVVSTGDVQLRSTSLETIASERFFDHVASGCVWTADAAGSTRLASMTAGVVYIGGKRVAVSAVTSRTFTASKDVYVDVDNTGTITYTDNTTNAASPALAANSIRLGIIVVGASSIATAASINQGQEDRVLPIASSVPYAVTDSLGNLICPRDPNRRRLGYKQISSAVTINSITLTDVAGLSCPVITNGRSVRIKVVLHCFSSGGTGAGVATIREGATVFGTGQTWVGNTTGAFTAIAEGETSPTAGSHTYKASITLPSTTSQAYADASYIAFIEVSQS